MRNPACFSVYLACRFEPASVEEIDRMRFHRERGTTPGNPKWWKRSELPKPKAFSMAQAFPAHCKPTRITAPVLHIQEECESTAQYIAEFERLNRLLPAVAPKRKRDPFAADKRRQKGCVKARQKQAREYREAA